MKKALFLFVLVGSLLLWGCAAAEEDAPAEDEAAEEAAGEEGDSGDAAMADQGRGTTELALAGKNITIEYGRPALDGRDMISQLPAGQPWRLGMNSASTLNTEARLTSGEAVVEPGQYRLWAMKTSETDWVLIVSSSLEGYEEANDVARIALTQGENAESVEEFTIELEGTGDNSGTFTATWGMLKLSADFTAE